MTDTLTELDPEALRRELIRLFAEPKSLHHIVAAGLDGVRRHLAQLSEAIGAAENGADQVVDTVAKLANLVRQEQRKHLGAVAQAQKERAAAELLWQVLLGLTIHQPQLVAERLATAIESDPYLVQLARTSDPARQAELVRASDAYQAKAQQVRAELGDCLLAASERQGAAARCRCGETMPHPFGGDRVIGPCIRPAHHPGNEHQAADGAKWAPLVPQQRQPVGGDRVRVTVEGDLVIDPRGFGEYTLAFRPGPNGTQIGYMGIPAHATITPLGANQPAPVVATGAPSRFAAVTCWCQHLEQSHVTDGADNAVCRVCVREQTTLHQAFHVHAPEQP